MTGQSPMGKIASRLKAAFSRQGQSQYREPQQAYVDAATQIRKLKQTRTRMTAAKLPGPPEQQP